MNTSRALLLASLVLSLSACKKDADDDGFKDDVDCNDEDASVRPDATEVCNGVDDDCDGLVDDEDDSLDTSTGSVFYVDADGDGYGDEVEPVEACSLPDGASEDGTDCDDTDGAVHPGATELCNGIDDDCNGEIDEDEAADAVGWFLDYDGDGFGDAAVSLVQCEQPEGYVLDDTDCDDRDPDAWPGADEYCDGHDDDCDGDVDEADAVDASTWYIDQDGDGYGDASRPLVECYQPDNHVADATDCDDADGDTWPGADEYCDGHDDDCDGDVDEADAVDATTWYADSDGDGYGDPDTSTTQCDQPTDYVEDDSDCDDRDDSEYPGADEYCDGDDDDCDGDVDEDDAVDVEVWYADADGDGYGDVDDWDVDCYQPSGYVDDATDCDDTDEWINPGSDEYCGDGEDSDCDGSTTDEDGQVTFWGTGGEPTHLTSTLSGTSTAAASHTLSDDGELVFCDGTFYVNLDVEADVDISSDSVDYTAVVLDGAGTGSVVDVAVSGVDVSVSDVTLQNGDGDASFYSASFEGGGGVACIGGGTSTLSVSSTWITDSTGEFGGGIAVEGCEVSLDDLLVDANTGTYGGGLLVLDSDVTITDSTFSDNEATYGGAYFAFGYTDSPSVSFEDSTVTDNTADEYGGVAYISLAEDVVTDTEISGNSADFGGAWYVSASTLELDGAWLDDNQATYVGGAVYSDGSDITCTGTTSTTAGFTTHQVTASTYDYGGAIYLADSSSTFTADTCDLGSTSGGDDNDPDDLYLDTYNIPYAATDDASFTCSSGTCGSESTSSVGGTSYALDFEDAVWGNGFYADTDVTLHSFSAYMYDTGSCDVDFYVLSRSSVSTGTQTWTVEWSDTSSHSPTSSWGWIESDDIEMILRAGTYYGLVFAGTCSSGATYAYYRTSSPGTNAGWGTGQAYLYNTSYSGSLSSTVSMYWAPTYGSIFEMDIDYTEL